MKNKKRAFLRGTVADMLWWVQGQGNWYQILVNLCCAAPAGDYEFWLSFNFSLLWFPPLGNGDGTNKYVIGLLQGLNNTIYVKHN